MRNVNLNLYEFSELSDDVQNEIIERIRYSSETESQYEDISDDYIMLKESELESYGFYDVKISYTGFYSQGDGASFVGKIKISDAVKLLNIVPKRKCLVDLLQDYIPIVEVYRIDFKSNHEYSVSVSIDDYELENIEQERLKKALCDLSKEIEDKMKDFVVDFSKEVYKNLESVYEDVHSDKNIIDILMNDDTEYFEDGTVYHG